MSSADGAERMGSTKWVPAPPHPREAERLAALRRYQLENAEADPAFGRITQLLARLLHVRVAAVTILDAEHQHLRGCVGTNVACTSRDVAFCSRTILQSEPLVVPNMLKDPVFRHSPLVVGEPHVRFYAGVAICDDDGLPLGSLCAMDMEPRRLGPVEVQILVSFGKMVEDAIRLVGSERRVREEVELRESAARENARLVSLMPGAMYRFALRPDGWSGMEYVSDGIRDILGYSPEEFIAGTAGSTELVHPEDLEGFAASVGESVATLEPWHWEGRLIAKGGEPRWVQGDSKPERSADGGVLWAGILTDITALKAHQDAIRAANAKLEERVQDRTEALEEAQSEILMRLGLAAEVRDDDTGAHIARVSQYCEILARGLGLAEEETDVIVRAAPMHDIGKISVPDSILLKPGKLDAAEIARMRAHAEQGARMLSGGSNELVRTAEMIARTHHERWDGTGYPHGLAGDEIPLPGRIVAIADVFDALTSERPYKRAWSIEEAAGEIARSAGSHFDPALVTVFLDHLPEFAAVARTLADARTAERETEVVRLAA